MRAGTGKIRGGNPSRSLSAADGGLIARLAPLTLCCVLLAWGTGLRVASLGDPVWLDELHTAWCVNGSLGTVADRAAAGSQVPLYFWIEYPIFYLLGANEFALRSVSLIAALGLLGSVPWLVWRWSGSWCGTILAAGLAALDDKFVFYSVEARPYALVQLAAVWQVAHFLRFVTRDRAEPFPKSVFVSFCALTWVLTGLHLTTFLLLGSELLVVTALVGRRAFMARSRIDWRSIDWRWLIPLAGCLPGLLFAYTVARHAFDWSVVSDPRRFGLLIVADVLVGLALSVLALWILQSGARAALPPRFQINGRGFIFGLTFLVLLPPSVALTVALIHWLPMAEYRFTIASSTLLPLLAGVLVARIASFRLRAVVTGVVLTLAVVTNPLLLPWKVSGHIPAQRDEDWRAIVARINAGDGPVLLFPNLVEDRRFASLSLDERHSRYYRFALDGLYTVESGRPVFARSMHGDATLTDEQITSLEQAGGGWVLIRARPGDAQRVIDEIEAQFSSNGAAFTLTDQSIPPLYLFRIDVHGFKRSD